LTHSSGIDEIFSLRAHVGYILRFEAALARALTRAGLIPAEAAAAITAACDAGAFDIPALERDGARAGTIVIPLVKELTARTASAGRDYVHWGPTSQDAIDTALVLQMGEGLTTIAAELREIAEAAARLATRHRRSVMPGRTLLQHAVPITFGLKAARWLTAITRQIQTLRAVRRDALVLQFGGAAGTLAALGEHGERVSQFLGEELHLPVPDLPWHAERDRPASVVSALGIVAGVLAKIASDVVLLAQTEIGEAAEGAAQGKGGSSAMPQKRNPVDAIQAIAATRLVIGLVPVVLSAMSQEHERGAGGWQTEWIAIPDAFRHSFRAARQVGAALTTLEVRPDRMLANLDAAGGTLMSESLATALAGRVGRPQAFAILGDISKRAIDERASLSDVARVDTRIRSVLDSAALERALDPAAYLGSTDRFIDRALAAWNELGA
jgi:3-carboxy-cis,cis-muconate cycloisomerase